MKKLSKIKLNQFSKDELEQRKMNVLKGGGCSATTDCGCSENQAIATKIWSVHYDNGGTYY
jgi:natural product precursor